VAVAAPAPAPATATAPAASPQLVIKPFTPAPAPDLRFVWRDHPSVRSRDLFRVDFAAKFQLDSRDPGDNPVDFDTVEVHRMRVGIEGDLFDHIQYSVERELKERETSDPLQKSSKSQWKDVYVEANYTDAAQVRVGKFKVPFGLDQTSGESNLDFVYRSLGGSYLSPGRDIGAMVHGRFFKRGLNYWAGAFKQDGENSRTSKIEGGDLTVAVRVTTTPFRHVVSALKDAEVGGSFATSELKNESVYPNGLRARTVMSQFVFFEPVFVNGDRRRFGVDADWTAGAFGARAEYIAMNESREAQGLGDDDLHPNRGRAWYALASYVLTGERKNRPVEPKHGGLFRGGMGAVEVAARYDRIRFDSEPGDDVPFRNSRAVVIYPNGNKVVTLGVNYYANRWIKLQLNGIRESIDDLERSPTLSSTPFWSTVFRLQLEL
jgi:phosphate-selective porin